MSHERRAELFLGAVVRPTLEVMGRIRPALHSVAAEQLLMGTAWHESGKLRYWLQVRGPARSPFQVEAPTHDWLCGRFRIGEVDSEFGAVAEQLLWPSPSGALAQLAFNAQYACFIARLRYYVDPAPLPDAFDWPELGAYWKRVFNTELGKGTVEQFLRGTREIRGLWPVS